MPKQQQNKTKNRKKNSKCEFHVLVVAVFFFCLLYQLVISILNKTKTEAANEQQVFMHI